MKASDLLSYLQKLERDELNPDIVEALAHFRGIAYTIKNHDMQIEGYGDEITKDIIDLTNAVNKFTATVNGLKDNLKTKILAQHEELYQRSQQLYEGEMVWDTAEYILNRRLKGDDQSTQEIISRIRSYSDWRLPGLCIRPGLETFVELMVPLYPMYLADANMDLLNPSITKFTPEFQRRLGIYIIDDYKHRDPLAALPDNQFGLIFAYNFLNYKPLKIIERYIRGFAQKLRPGGHAIFSYNECDIAQGVGLAEKSFMCFTPGHKIEQMVIDSGLDIVDKRVGHYDLSYMDVKKPGVVVSIKGAQTLAKIMSDDLQNLNKPHTM